VRRKTSHHETAEKWTKQIGVHMSEILDIANEMARDLFKVRDGHRASRKCLTGVILKRGCTGMRPRVDPRTRVVQGTKP
jgi:hypothetical protein